MAAKVPPPSNQRPPINILALAAEADALWFRDELMYAWRVAQDEAVTAYRAWCVSGDRTSYATYRAAQDRADQAQDVLAGQHSRDAGERPASGV